MPPKSFTVAKKAVMASHTKRFPATPNEPLTELVPMPVPHSNRVCKKRGYYSIVFKRHTYYYWLSHFRICIILNTDHKEATLWNNWDAFISILLPHALKSYEAEQCKKIATVLFTLEYDLKTLHARPFVQLMGAYPTP